MSVSRPTALRIAALNLLVVCVSTQAQQLSNVTTLLQNVLAVMQGVAVVAVSIAIIWVGYKLIFQQARWADVANIVFGAAFIGGATSIAHWLLG
jgi:type IV secretory pathway VirB2 component (pilin)